jgi:UDP-N-acetylglucosamine--N-acetylmuramyl-(pentapeptide) pyrophosphoryl-undecaprenol N-acetylglucosamine transferase
MRSPPRREERSIPEPRRPLAIVFGPTAGHVYPALAIADAYRRAAAGVDVLFIGAAGGSAARLLDRRSERVALVAGSALRGVGAGGKLRALPRVIAGMTQARRLLRAHDTRLVLGLGGYASGGVLLGARTLGLRTAIHEANVVPGLANRLLAPLAHRVYLGQAAARDAFAVSRRLVTGHPVRADIAAMAGAARLAPHRHRALRVLVTSGSRGMAFLSERVPDLLREVQRQGVTVEVLHQAGDVDPQPLRFAYLRAGVKASITPYYTDIAGAYRSADFAIARAGAGTVAELAAAGLPALLVPLADVADDHQAANARVFTEAGAGLMVREGDWDARTLGPRVAAFLGDTAAWTAASDAARAAAMPDAAQRIVADCEAEMAGRWS